ncbi:hypothetical protein IFR05_003757 [Cadophora sp. M221]|nr:hypothetical protein IFR05_003757 [Cadophora sp. M221]
MAAITPPEDVSVLELNGLRAEYPNMRRAKVREKLGTEWLYQRRNSYLFVLVTLSRPLYGILRPIFHQIFRRILLRVLPTFKPPAVSHTVFAVPPGPTIIEIAFTDNGRTTMGGPEPGQMHQSHGGIWTFCGELKYKKLDGLPVYVTKKAKSIMGRVVCTKDTMYGY